MSNDPTTSSNTGNHTDAQGTATEGECRAHARHFLVELIGEQPADLTWDDTHRLQGHVHVGGRELVVIANHDVAHAPVVLAAPSWDAIRRSSAVERHALLELCAITDRDHLAAVLEADELALLAG